MICGQLQQYDGHLVLCPPKTAHGERVIALDRTTVAALRAHHIAQQAEQAAAGEDYHDSGYVFTRPNGDPMAPDWLSRYFRQLSDALTRPGNCRVHAAWHRRTRRGAPWMPSPATRQRGEQYRDARLFAHGGRSHGGGIAYARGGHTGGAPYPGQPLPIPPPLHTRKK